jgi:hypothetical protein
MLGSFSVLSQFKVMLHGTAPLVWQPVIGTCLIVGSLLYVVYVMMSSYVSDNDEFIILPWMSDKNMLISLTLYCLWMWHYSLLECAFPGTCWQTMWRFARSEFVLGCTGLYLQIL